jgi:chromosome segregation ATPase
VHAAGRIPSPPHRHPAAAVALERSYEALKKQFAKADEASKAARAEARRSRELCATLEKDLDVSKRKVQELVGEKKVLEEDVKSAQTSSRRLEAKLLATIRQIGPGGLKSLSKLGEGLEQAKKERDFLAAKLAARDGRMAQLAREKEALSAALEIKEEEMGLAGGGGGEGSGGGGGGGAGGGAHGGSREEARASLLLSLATAREEQRRLRLEVAEGIEERKVLNAALDASTRETQELADKQNETKALEDQVAGWKGRAEKLQRELEEARGECVKLRDEMDVLLDEVVEEREVGGGASSLLGGRVSSTSGGDDDLGSLRAKAKSEAMRADAAGAALSSCKARNAELQAEVP